MRWFETPSFNFTGSRNIAYVVSGLLIILSIGAIIFKGLQFGIDFQGGKEIVLQFEENVDPLEIRSAVTDPLESAPEVKFYGSEQEVMIRTDNPADINEVENIIISAVEELYPDNSISVEKTDVVGPRFAEDLKAGALNAIIFSILVISVYILIRFKNWTYSLGSIAALVHDVLITVGIITILSDIVPFSLQIDQTIIAAFLTIVGYSLNDTVVVFDRIRENSLVYKTMDFENMMNRSLNDTLSRTVITSLTTLFVVTVLFIFGGEVLKGFSFSLIIGLLLGTYSSLYIASTTVLELTKVREKA